MLPNSKFTDPGRKMIVNDYNKDAFDGEEAQLVMEEGQLSVK